MEGHWEIYVLRVDGPPAEAFAGTIFSCCVTASGASDSSYPAWGIEPPANQESTGKITDHAGQLTYSLRHGRKPRSFFTRSDPCFPK
jgi:hypothetical protein